MPQRPFRTTIVLLFCIAALIGVPQKPSAQEPGESRALTEAVIRSQLEAMAAGDDARAYSYAAPSIQDMFPTADIFMQMVRDGYGALIAPVDFAFQRFESRDGRAIQVLNVVDRQGRLWRATYRMLRLEDGSWRIAGCMIEEIPGGSV
ncbi:MAG: DUF4864 domain-containing protein [Alphaproteobacteria bacterium]